MSTEIASAFEAERMNIAVEAPELSRALVALERELRIDPVLRELVKLRASILNGCAYCIDLHTKDARKADESEQRLCAVAAWHEAPFFAYCGAPSDYCRALEIPSSRAIFSWRTPLSPCSSAASSPTSTAPPAPWDHLRPDSDRSPGQSRRERLATDENGGR